MSSVENGCYAAGRRSPFVSAGLSWLTMSISRTTAATFVQDQTDDLVWT